MAKFVTVNCGSQKVLCNTDCSVQHVLVYLESKCDEIKQEIFMKDDESFEKNDQEKHCGKNIQIHQNTIRGRRAKQINLDECFTQYDLLDADGGLLDLSVCPARARVADILNRKYIQYLYIHVCRYYDAYTSFRKCYLYVLSSI